MTRLWLIKLIAIGNYHWLLMAGAIAEFSCLATSLYNNVKNILIIIINELNMPILVLQQYVEN